MKRYLILLSILLGGLLYAEERADTATSSVAQIAGTTTNTTPGTAVSFGERVPDGFRIYIYATSYAATTNGTCTFKFAPSYDGTTFVNPYCSTNNGAISLTITGTGTAQNGGTNVVSEWYAGYGIKAIRLHSIENATQGSYSNILPVISWSKKN